MCTYVYVYIYVFMYISICIVPNIMIGREKSTAPAQPKSNFGPINFPQLPIFLIFWPDRGLIGVFYFENSALAAEGSRTQAIELFWVWWCFGIEFLQKLCLKRKTRWPNLLGSWKWFLSVFLWERQARPSFPPGARPSWKIMDFIKHWESCHY